MLPSMNITGWYESCDLDRCVSSDHHFYRTVCSCNHGKEHNRSIPFCLSMKNEERNDRFTLCDILINFPIVHYYSCYTIALAAKNAELAYCSSFFLQCI